MWAVALSWNTNLRSLAQILPLQAMDKQIGQTLTYYLT